MDEFVKKLIERLEGESYLTTNDDGETNKFSVQVVEWKDIKKIVNQIAEEYNNESVKGDLISRSELIKWLKKVTVTDGITFETGFKQILTDIENQPTVYNNGWIPCSERLPKDEELSQRKEVVVQNRSGEVFTAQYTYNCAHTRKKFFRDNCAVPYVIAWQPLPASYQPKGE